MNGREQVEAMPVTDSGKRNSYVFVCAGCNGLAQSTRSDAVTCSPSCRVTANRRGAVNELREIARAAEVYKPGTLEPDPSRIAQAQAIRRLTPDQWQRCIRGEALPSQVMPLAVRAFLDLLEEVTA